MVIVAISAGARYNLGVLENLSATDGGGFAGD
jgi:hypothetical protein